MNIAVKSVAQVGAVGAAQPVAISTWSPGWVTS